MKGGAEGQLAGAGVKVIRAPKFTARHQEGSGVRIGGELS